MGPAAPPLPPPRPAPGIPAPQAATLRPSPSPQAPPACRPLPARSPPRVPTQLQLPETPLPSAAQALLLAASTWLQGPPPSFARGVRGAQLRLAHEVLLLLKVLELVTLLLGVLRWRPPPALPAAGARGPP